MKFESKVVIVTGAAANIGRAVAIKFAKEGARVVVNARKNVAGGKKVVDEICATGGKALFVQADVSKPEQVHILVDRTVAEFGTLDVLINNAGSVVQIQALQS